MILLYYAATLDMAAVGPPVRITLDLHSVCIMQGFAALNEENAWS